MNGSIFRKAIAIGILSSTIGIAGIALSTTSASASPVITAAPAALPKFGDNGPEVIRLQEAIMARGFSIKGGVTGSYSEATRSALRSLQKVAGFRASGTLDAKTAKFLGLVDVVAISSSSLPAVGTSGDAVWSVQQALINSGFAVKGGADGKFGLATTIALGKFQAAKGLAVTKVVDQATAIALGMLQAPKSAVASVVVASAKTVATPASPAAVVSSNFPKQGDRSETVKAIQTVLIKDVIGLVGGADGRFGTGTSAAIAEYQRRRGLNITGSMDDATNAAMFAAPVAAPVAPAAAVATAMTYETLPARGQSGELVRALQNALIANGTEVKGGADGVFGVATTVAISNFQAARALNQTKVLDVNTAVALALIPSFESLGLPTLQVFPMQGGCGFTDTWHDPRSGGRLHEGVDIIGAKGLAIYATNDGVISRMSTGGALGGNAIYVKIPNGTYFYYAHLDSFAPGMAAGVPVKAGQIIGYNGSTGTTTPHLHFEVHPFGGPAVNPYQFVKAVDACNVTTVLPQS
jgi:peptidoglycan hydrolase-like protein with peptidoglycan-binding domain